MIALDDAIDNMLTMYDNHNAIKNERVATYNSAAGGAVPSEFYLSQGKIKKSWWFCLLNFTTTLLR